MTGVTDQLSIPEVEKLLAAWERKDYLCAEVARQLLATMQREQKLLDKLRVNDDTDALNRMYVKDLEAENQKLREALQDLKDIGYLEKSVCADKEGNRVLKKARNALQSCKYTDIK